MPALGRESSGCSPSEEGSEDESEVRRGGLDEVALLDVLSASKARPSGPSGVTQVGEASFELGSAPLMATALGPPGPAPVLQDG